MFFALCGVLLFGSAVAQQVAVETHALSERPAGQVERPRYDGAAVEVYMARLVAGIRDLAVEERIPVDSLSEKVVLALRLDTLGRVVGRCFLDNTCSGEDRREVDPATPATQRIVLKACDALQGVWSPARRSDGRAVNYTLRMALGLPLGKIERAVNPDPLLFMGRNPYPAFYDWVRKHVGFNVLRFPGVNGKMRILFYIEPDGAITIDSVQQSPDKDLERRVVKVILRSKGKWTPRKVNGVPQRTPYEFRCNYIGNAY